ncbi:AMP-binding protein [Vibrio sp. M250220]|uniref:AMP-binding protein n=1 Tax=Vibrio sp. M250220 TaxID=3020894 RepID=UPI002F41123C
MYLDQADFCSLTDLLCAQRPSLYPVAFAEQNTFSWMQFQADIERFQTLLNQHSAEKIALCCANSYLFAVGFFAVCYANKRLVLPGNYQPEAVRELSSHFDLLLHDDLVPVVESVPSLLLSRSTEPLSEPTPYLSSPLDVDAVTLTLFTSGSSGKAKAIVKTLRQLDNEIAILESLWGNQLTGSRIESTVSHQHIYGLLFRLLWPLCSGRPFAVHNLEFPEQLVHHASHDTVLISSPALLKRLSEEHDSAPLRAIFSSGGPLTHSAALHSQELFGSLPIEVFGSTETGGIAHRKQAVPTTPWRLFPSVEAQLNSERCLRLKAPHIDGDNWYQTADECHFHDTVCFELKGRTDRIVKVEEKRISLVEVEKRLEQLDWIEESAVIPQSEGNRIALCAVIVLTPAGEQEITQLGKGKFWIALRQALRNWLEPIAIPRKYRVVDEVPLNSQGKRQVADIEKLFQS